MATAGQLIMIPAYQIPRNSLGWLLLGYTLSLIPHLLLHLPLGIWAAATVSLIWRVQVFRGIWSFPPAYVRYILVAMGFIGVFLGYQQWAGLESMLALLITALTLKLLETHSKRDVLVVVYLQFVVTGTLFLLDQSILVALYGLAVLLVTVTALLGLNQSTEHRWPLRSLRMSGKLILQALPLALILFLVMPRIGSLWSVPNPSASAKTGVSDSMSPGDFTKLGRSGELAFRASFENEIPSAKQLYWRGMVFSRFDGRRWTQARINDYTTHGDSAVRWHGQATASWEQQIIKQGAPLRYEITIEPTQQMYLFALPVAAIEKQNVGFTRDYRVLQQKPINKRSQYQVTSYLDYKAELELADWRYLNETQLPAGFNPQTIALARQWLAETPNTQDLIDRFLNVINQGFYYSLEPPALGRHTVDEFLFNTNTGFCEHFASSFVVFMRAAGVPARVVAGYQGGEVNPYENYLLVHQFDAHAWAEVWIEGQGWVRVDPTAAVAPERIEASIDNLSGADNPLALVNFKSVRLLNWARLQMDRIDYGWNRFVLGYDADLQSLVLSRLLGGTDALRIGLFMLGTIGLYLALILLRWGWSMKSIKGPPTVRYYRRFTDKLAKAGLPRSAGESPTAYAERVAEARPDLANAVRDITALFVALRYKPENKRLDDNALKRRVAGFKP